MWFPFCCHWRPRHPGQHLPILQGHQFAAGFEVAGLHPATGGSCLRFLVLQFNNGGVLSSCLCMSHGAFVWTHCTAFEDELQEVTFHVPPNGAEEIAAHALHDVAWNWLSFAKFCLLHLWSLLTPCPRFFALQTNSSVHSPEALEILMEASANPMTVTQLSTLERVSTMLNERLAAAKVVVPLS